MEVSPKLEPESPQEAGVAGLMSTKPTPTPKPKPHLPFLFGRQDQPSTPRTKRVASATASSQVGSQDLASIAHSNPHPPVLKTNSPQQHQHQHHNDPSPRHQSLDLALQISARSSFDSNCSDLLHDFIPLTFAPTMAASPAGGGHA